MQMGHEGIPANGLDILWQKQQNHQKTPIRRSYNSPKENESNFQDSEE
jgi:hypothetical protein